MVVVWNNSNQRRGSIDHTNDYNYEVYPKNACLVKHLYKNNREISITTIASHADYQYPTIRFKQNNNNKEIKKGKYYYEIIMESSKNGPINDFWLGFGTNNMKCSSNKNDLLSVGNDKYSYSICYRKSNISNEFGKLYSYNNSEIKDSISLHNIITNINNIIFGLLLNYNNKTIEFYVNGNHLCLIIFGNDIYIYY